MHGTNEMSAVSPLRQRRDSRTMSKRLRRAFSFRRRGSCGGSKELLEFGPDNPGCLEEIRLFDMQIGDDRVLKIANSLRKNSQVKTLNLSRNRFGEDGTFALAMALQDNKTVERVILGGNMLGTSGVSAIANAISKPDSSVMYLALPQSQIGDVGAGHIADGLKTNVRLKDLYLHSNMICDAGAASLAEGLKNNKSLRAIDLSDNAIGDDGILALLEGVTQNKTLKHLFLGDNRFSQKGLEHLVELARRSSTLTILDAKQHFLGSTSPRRELCRHISYYLSLNDAGRGLIRDNCNPALVPKLLAKVTWKVELLYGLIREQPHFYHR